MSTKEILREINRLPYNQKLLIIEKTKDSLKNEKKNVLGKAASILMKEYKSNKELTLFTYLEIDNYD